MSTQIWAHRGASAYAPEKYPGGLSACPGYGGLMALSLIYSFRQMASSWCCTTTPIDRTSSGTGRLSDMTLWQLKELDFSMGMSQYAGARIPTAGGLQAAGQERCHSQCGN